MSTTADQLPAPPIFELGIPSARVTSGVRLACLHCGTPCNPGAGIRESGAFCCAGCRTVYELLHENGLSQFYTLQETPGNPVRAASGADRFRYLDAPSVRERLVDYSDERRTKVTFRLPSIHCIACVWLLENLFRLRPGIERSRVNFGRREVSISFDPREVGLGEVASLLDSLGYPPDLTLADLDRRKGTPESRRLWLQIGVAGFAFGNTMLFSLPSYFGLDSTSGPGFRALVGWLSLALSLPVVAFSALDYWRTAWNSLRLRRLTLEVPIAVGIATIFLQSVTEVISGRGEGYFDSLAGLLFFLLCGRLFQQKTYDRLSFDRDYTAFFPLSVIRLGRAEGAPPLPHAPSSDAPPPVEERVALAQLRVGDRLRLRSGELIPADSRLLRGAAVVDYSFVTGESEPVVRTDGDLLYAGGRQTGGAIEVAMVKPVSESYLASLWNQEAFRKEKDDTFNTLTNRLSRRFTWTILGLAVGAALFWAARDPSKSVRSFTGVLIVACPCALALAAPFTLGAALRVLGRRQIHLRNAEVIEALARVDTVVFDKTGTLTSPHAGEVRFLGTPLGAEDAARITAVARQSSHPLSARIAATLAEHYPERSAEVRSVTSFTERAGAGVEGLVDGCRVTLGSAAWVSSPSSGVARAVDPESESPSTAGSVVHVALDGIERGAFALAGTLRPEIQQLLQGLTPRYETALLSGDHARDSQRFARLFAPGAALRFHQTPSDKLEFVRELQKAGRAVMMVGDGLNDAGALRQSDVGVAVVETVGAFSPASDVILDASQIARLAELLRFSRQTVGVVRVSFAISALYNVVGLAIAASGNLAPVVCAILMPLSSATVVGFAVGLVHILARRSGLGLAVKVGESESFPVTGPVRREAWA